MKKTSSLGVAILLLIFFISCKKEGTTVPVVPGVVFTSLKANPGTAWYNSSVTISGSATNTSSFSILSEKFNGSSFNWETPKLTTPTIFNVLGIGPGGSVTKSIAVDVYSQDTSALCRHGSFRQVSNIWYALADSLNPSAWHDNTLDPNIYTFLPNGGAQINGGEVSQGAWTILQATQNLEGVSKKRLAMQGDIWDIDVLNSAVLGRSQITKNLFDTTKLNKTIQKFSH